MIAGSSPVRTAAKEDKTICTYLLLFSFLSSCLLSQVDFKVINDNIHGNWKVIAISDTKRIDSIYSISTFEPYINKDRFYTLEVIPYSGFSNKFIITINNFVFLENQFVCEKKSSLALNLLKRSNKNQRFLNSIDVLRKDNMVIFSFKYGQKKIKKKIEITELELNTGQ